MSKRNRKQSRHLPAFLLLFLRHEKLYGSQLIEKLKQITPDNLVIEGGSVYRTLRELEEDGFISSDWVIQDGSKPIRIYQMTASGKVELDFWYQEIAARRQMLTLFMKEYELEETNG